MTTTRAHPTPNGVSVWLLAARPRTLWAAVSPVVLGTAIAAAHGVLHAPAAMCALLGAMLIQVATNYSNDYHDFVKGADAEGRKGPLRATQAGLVSPGAMRAAAILTFGLAFVVGIYLIVRGGWPILTIGILSIISGIWYTAGRYSLAYLGIADAFVLIFFGPVAVGGTYFVQALSIEASVVLAGVGPGALAVAILLVNNIRDINEDRAAGKQTLVVRIGRDAGVNLYATMFIVAGVLPLLLVTTTGAPLGVLAASVVPLFGRAAVRRVRHEDTAAELNGLLAKTSQLLFAYCLVLSVGWFIG